MYGLSFCFCLVHCDVRWPNIIFVPKTRKYILVDFEFARAINAPVPAELKQEFTNPNLSQTRQWDQSGDTYQVVLMIESALKVHVITNPVFTEHEKQNFLDADQLIQRLDALRSVFNVK